MAERSHTTIRLLIAESFELVRLGLRALFENHPAIHLVAETDDIENLINLAAQHKPDVLLVDLQLSNGDCEYIPKLLHTCPQSKILVFSYHHTEQTYLQAFRAGASGIIGKHHSSELLLKAIFAIHGGQIWFDRHVTKLLWQAQFGSNSPTEIQTDAKVLQLPKLSNSECHIAYLACQGLSTKEIGQQLFVAEKTVRNQLSILYKKIGVKSRIELCLKAPLYDYFEDSHPSGTFYPKNTER